MFALARMAVAWVGFRYLAMTLKADMRLLVGVLVAAFVVGHGVNALRSDGVTSGRLEAALAEPDPGVVPLDYSGPAGRERLEAAVASLRGRGKPGGALMRVGVVEFAAMVPGRDVLAIDARPPAFFARGHVPGAVNLSREGFAKAWIMRETEFLAWRKRPVVVYCGGGTCEEAERLGHALVSLGFEDVLVLAEGWSGWLAGGGDKEVSP